MSIHTIVPKGPAIITRELAVLDLVEFVHTHIAGLWTLAERLEHPDAVPSCEALLALADQRSPAPADCVAALGRIRAILESVTFAELNRLEQTPGRPGDAGASLRWFGARLTDLELRLQRLD